MDAWLIDKTDSLLAKAQERGIALPTILAELTILCAVMAVLLGVIGAFNGMWVFAVLHIIVWTPSIFTWRLDVARYRADVERFEFDSVQDRYRREALRHRELPTSLRGRRVLYFAIFISIPYDVLASVLRSPPPTLIGLLLTAFFVVLLAHSLAVCALPRKPNARSRVRVGDLAARGI